MESFIDFDAVRESAPLLLQGLLVTIQLILMVVPIGLALGLAVAVLHRAATPGLRRLVEIYIDILRAFPALVLIVLVFYGWPFLGIKLGEKSSVVLALSVAASGFYGEIFRAAIGSVARGQWEAARATGFNAAQTFIYVVLPQAFRRAIPPLLGNTIELSKGTALAAVVSVPELLRNAQIAQNATYSPAPLMAAALIFYLLFAPLVRIASLGEARPTWRR
ncbi:MAG: amino acid ABC transporter permease [Burkholderiales bacterium]